jgi:hypothetical protein
LGVQKKQISQKKNLKVIASLFYTFYNVLRIVTKVNFNKKHFFESVRNGTLINEGSWVAYFVLSFCFESMSLSG